MLSPRALHVYLVNAKFNNSPDDADVEFRIVVIAIELISDSGDHIFSVGNFRRILIQSLSFLQIQYCFNYDFQDQQKKLLQPDYSSTLRVIRLARVLAGIECPGTKLLKIDG